MRAHNPHTHTPAGSSRRHASKTLSVVLAVVAVLVAGTAAWASQPDDDTQQARFPVAPTAPEDLHALEQTHPADLRNPENLKTDIQYDWRTGRYLVRTMVGDTPIGYAIPLSAQEYQDYTERRQRAAFFRQMGQKETEEYEGKSDFDLLDMQFSLGPAERIFGKGGIRVRTQGSASMSMGMKHNVIDNPTLSEDARDQWTFDFKEDVQLNMRASIGSKMSFDLNYNTDATFDFDATKFKLAFAGEEDDIIKNLEAGNVSMTTGNSLIPGGSSLFGVKTQLRFGRLDITALLAKQESTSKSVSSKGGVTKRNYELVATNYDQNRHFFMGHFFHDTYDQNMARLPLVASGIEITKVEVWMTNKRGDYDNARNILAFTDMGEGDPAHLQNAAWGGTGTGSPDNRSNDLYATLQSQTQLRDITQVTTGITALAGGTMVSGHDYEKVESARLLNSSEYTLNAALGYISLKTRIDDDCVLAVAFQYTRGGQTYQVGEFSTDRQTSTETLYVKLLKSTTGDPQCQLWDLMMKNIYSLGVTNLQKQNFTMQIQYLSDTVGTYTNYINEPPLCDAQGKPQLLVKVMGLDRLNQNNERHSDGQFDWVPNYTIVPATGRIIFPVVEPFNGWLAQQLGDDPTLVERYCYPELYRQTLTDAEQVAEKNKFRIRGEYSASSGAEINLGAMNVARGSVRVTAGGATLTEGSDYSVDYAMGVVTILNESIIESGTSVNVTLEDQSEFSLQRKTMMGLDLQYNFSKDLQFGGTVINLHETPLTTKVAMTEIPINNTIYGFNLKWNKDFMWLTNLVGGIPWIKATAPSNFNMQAEFAQLIAGHSSDIGEGGYIYVDDFEGSESSSDISSPTAWQLASTPTWMGGSAYDEGTLTGDVAYNRHRAHLSWYKIDNLFTSQTSSLTPGHIKNDLNQLSDHRVRQINFDEIYPNKELEYGETGVLEALNLTYYPRQRGPYNIDATTLDHSGQMADPRSSWAGMMRAMDVTNFEQANYQYIEFWMMDPFMPIDGQVPNTEGHLIFHLGEISEDILKDGRKSFENGLDVTGGTDLTDDTTWGRVSRRTSTVYAFDNSTNSHETQDVGLNGINSQAEQQHPTYRKYLDDLNTTVTDGDVLTRWQRDPFSPINDPGGDNYHYFRGADYDEAGTSILERYKYINGTEGNSPASTTGSYSTAYKSTPDVEDLNRDNTLNENERFFEYDIHLYQGMDQQLDGSNYLVDVETRNVTLRNGQIQPVRWFLFRIPLLQHSSRQGNITSLKSIRFMRMLMTGWQEEQTLRLASLDLVRSDWRQYTGRLVERGHEGQVSGTGVLAASTVNIEEHSGATPVNYVLPPGITREVTPGNTQVRQNEQSIALKVTDLEPHDAVAIYKNSGIDLRQYERLQLFNHAHAEVDDATGLQSGDLAIFVRLGADYKDNYYEYEIPLALTPHSSTYSSNTPSDRQKVWPLQNMMDLKLTRLTELKRHRNSLKQTPMSGIDYMHPYSEYDPDHRSNRMTIVGNPSLSDATVIMIGVRNIGNTTHSGTVWVDELRTDGMDEQGGWAARAGATLRISDLATLNGSGSYKSVGWGTVEQSAANRSLTEDYEYTLSGQTDLGRWLPKQVHLNAPFYYSYSRSVSTPKYDPYNEDLTVDETLDTYHTESQRDSIRNLVQTVDESRSLSLTGVKFDVKSKHSMPWDPANITLGYSQNQRDSHNPTTEYQRDNTYKGTINYNWTPYFKPWKPFVRKTSGKGNKNGSTQTSERPSPRKIGDARRQGTGSKSSPFRRFGDDFQLNWLPNNISLSTAINRTYHEEQLRNVQATESDFSIPVSYTKSFTWLRQTNITWDLTKTLKFSFQSATNARIDEPDTPVNKNLYPEEYEAWKDTIWTQIWKLGTPVAYNQQFDAQWQIPLNKITWFDWLQSSIKYKSTYQWDRGTQIDAETETGNTIENNAQWQGDVRLNLETLYNKSKFLKKANDKFRSQSVATLRRNATNRNTATARNGSSEPKRKREFTQEIVLKGQDTTVVLKHNLNTRRLIVTAHRDSTAGRPYRIDYKVVDGTSLRFKSSDSVTLHVTVKPDKPLDDMRWYKTLQVTSRILMMVRSVQAGYKDTRDTYLPYFRPEVGDFYGEGRTDTGTAPGLGFAFGFEGGESYTREAMRRGWLICSDSLTTPAVYSHTRDLSYSATLEPWTGLKIDLTGSWKHNEKESHQFMAPDLPIKRSGSFQMTTIALGSSFGGTDAGDGYSSEVFQRFLDNRAIINERLLSRYDGTRYPEGGFVKHMTNGSTFAGTPYSRHRIGEDGKPVTDSRINSGDVLVPAFIAAYMGGDAHTVSLSPFPAMWKALPNWRVTYDGLIQVFPSLSKWFKSVQLTHAYNCTYAVGNYQSYANYVENEQGLGFMLDVTNNCPVPATEFDIQNVTLTESYAPLAGLNVTTINGITARAEYRHTRSVSLNMSAIQVVENISKDLTVGLGYKIANFNTIIGLPSGKQAGVNHDLNMRFDMTHKNQMALLRKVTDQYSEATSGNTSWSFKFAADYQFSKVLQFKVYYDRQVNTPLISTAYPTINSDFGMTLTLSLTR